MPPSPASCSGCEKKQAVYPAKDPAKAGVLGSIAAAIGQCMQLAESKVLYSAGKLGFLIDQAGGRMRRAPGEKSRAQSYRKNDRSVSHRGSFLGVMIVLSSHQSAEG